MHQRKLTNESKHLMMTCWRIVASANDKIQIRRSWNWNKVRLRLTFPELTKFYFWGSKVFLFANLFILNVSDYAFRSDLAARAVPILISALCWAHALFVLLPAHLERRQLSLAGSYQRNPFHTHPPELSGWQSLRAAISPPATLDATFSFCLLVCLLDLQFGGHLSDPSVYSWVLNKCS